MPSNLEARDNQKQFLDLPWLRRQVKMSVTAIAMKLKLHLPCTVPCRKNCGFAHFPYKLAFFE